MVMNDDNENYSLYVPLVDIPVVDANQFTPNIKGHR